MQGLVELLINRLKMILIFINRNQYPKDKIGFTVQEKSGIMKGICIGTIYSFQFVLPTKKKKVAAWSNSSETKPLLPTG